MAYVFEQRMNPQGEDQLVAYSDPSIEIEKGDPGWKRVLKDEPLVRFEIRRLLELRAKFDRAIANPDATSRATELAGLVTSADDYVIRAALAKLSSGSKEAANALLPFVNDEGLMRVHWQILDTIAATGARGIPLDFVIRRESAYWSATCHQALDEDWVSNYGEDPAFHYFRLVSALRILKTASSKSDLSALKELSEIVNHCQDLKQRPELVNLVRGLLTP
jgi:hypothetical protein